MLAELAGGLVTNLIYDGLRGAFSDTKHELAKRSSVRRAIAGTPEDTIAKTLATKSLADLARVLGGGEGALTDNAHSLIEELRRGAVAEILLQLVILNKSADEAFPAFDVLYRMCAPLPFTSRQFFDALTAAIRYRIESSSDDPVMLEVVRAFGSDVRKQLRELRSYLDRTSQLDGALDVAAYRDASSRVARSIEAAHKELTVETMRGAKRIPISKLVIPARLRTTDNRAPETPARGMDSNSMSLVEFRRTFRNAVILGDPGGGKSTSTQLLCYELAKNITQSSSTENGSTHPHDLRIPLRVTVRLLDSKQQKDPAYSILDYITDDIRSALDNNHEHSRRFLVQTLSLGNCVCIFDGLDEILDVERRRSMATQIEQFSAIYFGCPVLVTSRVVGYRDAPLGERFSAYTLSRFNRDEVLSYSTNLIRAIKRAKIKEARDLAEKFVSQTERLAADLRENPLMLGLMVYIYMERGSVPDNRPEIYKQCSLLMFERWDSHRGIKPEIEDDFTLMDLFGHVAVKVFGDPELEEGVSRDWLLREVGAFFQEWYGDKPRAVRAARNLAQFITGRAWVMCDVGPDRYKFTHRTFLEYFVARHIENQSETVSDLIRILQPRIVKGEWDVVCHLALQLSAESVSKSQKICDQLKEMCETTVPDPDALNILTFAAHAVEYLNVPEPRTRLLASTIVDSAIKISDRSFASASFVIAALVYNSSKRISIVSAILQSFVRTNCRLSTRLGHFSRYLLQSKTVWIPGAELTLDNPSYADYGHSLWMCLDQIRANEKSAIYAVALHDAAIARGYWAIYEDRLAELYKTHGQVLIAGRLDDHAVNYEHPLIYLILSTALEDWHFRSPNHVMSSKTAAAAILIADDIVRNGLRVRIASFLVELAGNISGYIRWSGDTILRLCVNQDNEPIEQSRVERLGAVFVIYATLLESEINNRITGAGATRDIGDRKALIDGMEPFADAELVGRMVGKTKYASEVARWMIGERDFVGDVSGA